MHTRASQRPPTSEQFVYHALRTEILAGLLEPGERLVQADWAERLGVSVTPVREALRRLQSEGMVEMVAHAGATIRQLNIGDAREIYRLRILIEPLAVEKAIDDLHPGVIEEAAELLTTMDETVELSEWLEHNRAFHELLMTASDSWMSRILDMLRAAAAPFVGLSLLADPGIRQTSNREHHDLVSAFASRDVDTAKRITKHHLERTLDALEKAHAAGRIR